MLKSKTLNIINQHTPTRMAEVKKTTVGKDMEQVYLSYIADGNGKGTATLENSMAVSYKVKHTLTYTQKFYCG